jgi:hypothetical protein
MASHNQVAPSGYRTADTRVISVCRRVYSTLHVCLDSCSVQIRRLNAPATPVKPIPTEGQDSRRCAFAQPPMMNTIQKPPVLGFIFQPFLQVK